MREIKFKAYFKVDKRIYDVWAINFSREEIELFDKKMQVDFEASFDDVELMQYTGLKDKNGVEIYEGDIIKAKFIKDGSDTTGWVEYFDKDASFICHLKGGDYALLVALSELEVIGDIHNNKRINNGLSEH